jgi:hypothetical protein
LSGYQARVWKPRSRGEIDAQRNARTRAVFRVAIAEWLNVHELKETTRDGYEMYARNYINPALSDEPVSKISARVLEQFYANFAGAGRGAMAGLRLITGWTAPTSAAWFATSGPRVAHPRAVTPSTTARRPSAR